MFSSCSVQRELSTSTACKLARHPTCTCGVAGDSDWLMVFYHYYVIMTARAKVDGMYI